MDESDRAELLVDDKTEEKEEIYASYCDKGAEGGKLEGNGRWI